ncbi:MAG: hypothetical protein ACLTS6_19560 [Anaerobutyricum sp.]
MGIRPYVICPMIEESEKMDLENVEEYARMLSQALTSFHYGCRSKRSYAINGKE